MPRQPTTTIELSEYELQVLETITQHAIDAGAIRADLFGCVADVQRRIKGARAELAIARRRLAVAQQARGGGGGGDAA